MKSKFLFSLALLCVLSFVNIHQLRAQTKEELQELLNSETRTKAKSDKWEKKKKKKTETVTPQVTEEKKTETKVTEKKETPKKAETIVEKKEEPKPEPKKEVVKEEPKHTEPVAVKKEEPKAEPKKEAKKEEPKKEQPKPAEAKKEEPKAEPKKEAKKEEVKKEQAKPAEAKKEEPKKETKKEEAKPSQQSSAKTEEPKKEAVKVEPKKEEPKPAPVVVEQKREEPKPITQPTTSIPTENLQPERAREANAPLISLAQPADEKLKEIPEPSKVGWRKDKRLGKKLFAQGSINNSIRYYNEALSKKSKKTFLNQNLADEYMLVRDYVAANGHYQNLVTADSVKHKNVVAIYQLGLTEKYLGNYEKAKEDFQKFSKLTKDDDKFDALRKNATREAQGCDLGISLRNNKDLPEFKTTHLTENINQPLTDFSPVLRGNNTLYYGSWNSDRTVVVNKHEKYADYSHIYFAKKNGAAWTKGEMVAGGVNEGNFHSGNPAFTADGNTMYYTQCNQDDLQRMRCNIYKSNLQNGEWLVGEKLDANVNAEGFTSTHPAIGKNETGEDVLYFSSDRNPEKGMDLFYAKLNADGSVAKSRSVGPTINTKGDEVTPSYDFKTRTLYFSSNGRVNIGGLDVYKTNAAGGEWVEPQHLGAPINSSVDDMYYNWSEKNGFGFVVSNREGGLGLKSATCCDDIYQVEKTRLFFAVRGTVQNADENFKPIDNALVTLYNVSEGKELKNNYATNGNYFFDLEKEHEYQIITRKKGFEDLMQGVSTLGKTISDTVTLDLPMKMIPAPLWSVGSKVGTVYWEFNKDYLTDGAPDTLNKVVSFMNEFPNFVLEIGSHTDAKGTDEYNLKLSQRRSDAVLKYVSSKNIAKSRLQSKAYGESKPVELNEDPAGTDNPSGRTKNRRTEFVIVQEMTPAQIEEAAKAEADAKLKGKKGAKTSAVKNTKPAEKKTEKK